MLKKFVKGMVSTALGLSLLAAPAMADPLIIKRGLPVETGRQLESGSQIQQVRDHHRRDGRRGFYRDGRGGGYYNGHRGYRERRRGYREYNGYWFPPAAFALGVIIGQGANRVEPGVRPGYTSPAHLNWCSNRYRSYRAYDNSWQPNYGPRRECRSPYF